MKHLLTLADLGRSGLIQLLDDADLFKRRRGAPAHRQYLAGRSVALVFEKASTRTRISLEVAVGELGGTPLVITKAGSQLDRGEPLKDTARVLSRMVHAITFRTFSDEALRELAEHSAVPVLNALTDGGHPMQLLADLQTVRREFHALDGLKYAWIGDGNNMANSWIEAADLLGLSLDLGCPAGFEPDPALVRRANQNGARVRVLRDPMEAARDAHVINTDVFASMGQEQEAESRAQAFQGYCVTPELMAQAKPDAIALHCLPAHRGEEISAEVIDGPQSRVWDQAEARLHTSKAALCWALDVQIQ
ncbi:MAG TPA: ornithine carbamoyltransferase [Polyangiaceae bacterium]|jgi:ornithine carbamoyltransferase|nr:ornithine carbamoyltransferase [Polyangiaceae bacterium]